MKKIGLIILSVMLIAVFSACQTDGSASKDSDKAITIAVGIVPEATFVEKVAGDLVDVITLIPPGNSPANYQPTAAEMQALSDATVYFAMQTPTEEANILPKVKDFNKDLEIVNLRDMVSGSYPLRTIEAHSHDEDEDEDHEDEEGHEDEEDHEHEETVDPHIWLSPRRVIVMVEAIADKLSEIDEKNAGTYRENAEKYIEELMALDEEITQSVKVLESKTFLIYHGAYGYFSDDYGLEMVSLESSGKPITAAGMQEVIDFAKTEGITTVFYQVEFSDVQAKTVAEEIGGSVTQAEPLSPDYIQGLKNFLEALNEQGE